MILEYFSLGKGYFTKPWGRLEKCASFYFRIITSYLKMSGMLCNIVWNFTHDFKGHEMFCRFLTWLVFY